VYLSPEAFGLEQVDSLDEAGLSYAFHMLIAWREKATGALLWAEDSGCSCPAPFERYTSIDDLDRDMVALQRAADRFPAPIDERHAFLRACGL
jgi:hypothetical protein